eukprot:gnl/MRDRNA2_/MRDRNA2_114505_c0_seq1.p1 gnl/MRDRNA2_/MRDRNA2_114505_c0~~gnl/MRDRNA2_/MRDRNA2_114505_c0_seq1.p1  ORF type:complete len:582 (+),score=121.43 gnl/MRDRNA2_/MRDRNA2_114505_c0_seq1:92-1837(+)
MLKGGLQYENTQKKVGAVSVNSRYHFGVTVDRDYNVKSQVLGTGLEGSVVLAKNKVTKKPFAVKSIATLEMDKDQLKRVAQEAEIFLTVDHPHISRLVDIYHTKGCVSFVMQQMEGGELFDRIVKKGKYTECDAGSAAYQMLLAMSYLHGRSITHRDLKCENFLYEDKKGDHLAMIDFGFANMVKPGMKTTMTDVLGTLDFMAPEVLRGSYTEKCDMWSFGVIVFMMLAGKPPFGGPRRSDDEIINRILGCTYEMTGNPWPKITAEGKDFVQSLLNLRWEDRLSAQDALNHPWIVKRKTFKSCELDISTVQDMQKFSQATECRKVCLQAMAWSLTAADRKKMQEKFIEMDTDDSGTVSIAELKQAMEELNVPIENPDVIFKTMDANGDDSVSYNEFLTAMAHTRVHMHADLIRDTFRRFDVDESGYISVDELQDLMGSSTESNNPTFLHEFFAEVDTSCDGQISYDEFAQYMKGYVDKPRVEVTVQLATTDRNGCVVKPEKKVEGLSQRDRIEGLASFVDGVKHKYPEQMKSEREQNPGRPSVNSVERPKAVVPAWEEPSKPETAGGEPEKSNGGSCCTVQ